MQKSDKLFFLGLSLLLVIGGIIGLCAFAQIRTPDGTINVIGRGNIEITADTLSLSFDMYRNSASFSGVQEEFKNILTNVENYLSGENIEYILNERAQDSYFNTYEKSYNINKYFAIELKNPIDFEKKEVIVEHIMANNKDVNYQGHNYYMQDNSNLKEIKNKVRKQAYLDARAVAEETAQTLGVKIKDIASSSEGTFYSSYYGYREDKIYLDALTGSFTTEVSLSYSIK